MPSAALKPTPRPDPEDTRNEEREVQFLRHGLTGNGLFESICFHCGGTIACSPDMQHLQAAEESHVCPPPHKRRVGFGPR